jgi:hypothetical protein
VLARFESFPVKKLETLRTAAALYSKLDAIATELHSLKIVSPMGQLLDKVERYFTKVILVFRVTLCNYAIFSICEYSKPTKKKKKTLINRSKEKWTRWNEPKMKSPRNFRVTILISTSISS